MKTTEAVIGARALTEGVSGVRVPPGRIEEALAACGAASSRVASLVADFSEAWRLVERDGALAPDRLDAWFAEQANLRRYLGAIAVTSINPGAAELFGAPDEASLLSNLAGLAGEGIGSLAAECGRHLLGGARRFAAVAGIPSFDGQGFVANVDVSLPAGATPDWTRVFVSIVDMTAPLEQLASAALARQRDVALLALPRVAESLSEREFLRHGLSVIERVTESAFAFAWWLGDGEERAHAIWSETSDAGTRARLSAPDGEGPLSPAWRSVLEAPQPVVSNDGFDPAEPKDGAENVPFERLLTVRVVDPGGVRLAIACGNCPRHYTPADVDSTRIIGEALWNIVRHRRAQKLADERAALLRDAERATEGGTWSADLEARTVVWSAGAAAIVGVPPGSTTPIDALASRVDARDAKRVRMEFAQAVANRSDTEVQLRLAGDTAEPRWLNIVARFIPGDDHSPPRLAGAIVDVTRRVQQERRLRDAAAAIACTGDGVLFTDLDGTILDVNPAFTRITGYTREEAVGSNPRILHSGVHDPMFYREMWRALQTRGAWSGEVWNRRRDGTIYPEILTINRIGEEDDAGYVAVFSDISRLKEAQARLEHIANFDALTNLANRRLLSSWVSTALREARSARHEVAVVAIDIDVIGDINEALGHVFGDALLIAIAERLRGLQTDEVIAARIGGEFALAFRRVEDRAALDRMLEELGGSFAVPFDVSGLELRAPARIGVAVSRGDRTDADALIRNAGAAMHRARETRSEQPCLFTTEFAEQAMERVRVGAALRGALVRDEFALVYQPQVRADTGRLVGCEALLRWAHPELGSVSPATFVPIAERTGSIGKIGAWVLREAVHQMRRWLDEDFDCGRVSVNVSGEQFKAPGFAEFVFRTLEAAGLEPSRLELEVTETLAADGAESARAVLDALRVAGVRVALDDFGTGYSSLSYIKRLPLDRVKIDRAFISELPHDHDDRALVEAILAVTTALELEVIAEGVETEEQRAYLVERGCMLAQGYFFSRPLDPGSFAQWATANAGGSVRIPRA